MKTQERRLAVVNILATLTKGKSKAKDYTLFQIKTFIKDFGKMERSMAKELMFIIQLELNFVDNGMKVKSLRGNGYSLMVIIMKENSSIISLLEMVFGNFQMEINWMGIIDKLLFHQLIKIK